MIVYDKIFMSLIEKDIVPDKDFNITTEMITAFLSEYNLITNSSGMLKRKEARYCVKLAALSYLKYKRSLGFSTKEGFVYLISNEAWPNYYKVGMSSFPKERLASFQTYSPFRDYKLHHWSFWFDKQAGERFIHTKYNNVRSYEWLNLEQKDLLGFYTECHSLSGTEQILNTVFR